MQLGSCKIERIIVKERKAYTREERRLMIIQAFAVEIQDRRGHYMTTADIARKLHVTPSTKLRIILNEMVLDEILLCVVQEHPGIAGYRRLYSLAQSHWREALRYAQACAYDRPRKIKINTAQGVLWGELP